MGWRELDFPGFGAERAKLAVVGLGPSAQASLPESEGSEMCVARTRAVQTLVIYTTCSQQDERVVKSGSDTTGHEPS